MTTLWHKLQAFTLLLKLKSYIPLIQLLTLRRSKRYEPGKIKTKLGYIRYTDALTLIAGFEEIFIDEIYKVGVFANERPTIIDCGANIGLSALYFALKYGADVLAFEADPAIYQCLIENTKHTDHTQGKISTVNKAIWIDDEGVDFDIEGGFSGQIHQHGHSLVKSTQRVPSVSLRETLSGFSHVDLLKIDIEGAENQVILDCEGILNVADYIFIEWHSITSDPQLLGEILNVLKKEGFRYHIKEAFTSRSPFVLVEEMCGMDLQLNIFALKAIC